LNFVLIPDIDPGLTNDAIIALQDRLTAMERTQLQSFFSAARQLGSDAVKAKGIFRRRLAKARDRATIDFFSSWASFYYETARILALKMRHADGLEASIISENTLRRRTPGVGEMNPVVEIVLRRVPMVRDDVPWEQILEFRQDEEARGFLRGLRVWMSELVQCKLSPVEIEDKLEWLLFQRSQHLKAHRLAHNLDAFGGVFVASVEIIEDLIKVKWGKAARGMLALANRKAQLMKLEMEDPGKEIHYLLKMRDRFG
jgi:hypothetical protein